MSMSLPEYLHVCVYAVHMWWWPLDCYFSLSYTNRRNDWFMNRGTIICPSPYFMFFFSIAMNWFAPKRNYYGLLPFYVIFGRAQILQSKSSVWLCLLIISCKKDSRVSTMPPLHNQMCISVFVRQNFHLLCHTEQKKRAKMLAIM